MKKSHSKTMTQEKSSELGPGNMKRKPWKVYQRDNTEVSFRLTERDIEILKFIYKFRCVNTEQIHALFGGSKQVVWRRLKYLFQGGYIDRIRARQVKDYNAPMIYGLGNRGADYLSETLGVLMPKSDWTTKNRTLKLPMVDHDEANAQIVIAFDLASRSRADVEMISREELINRRPVDLSNRLNPLGWQVEGKNGQFGAKKDFSSYLAPDDALGLRLKAGSGKTNSMYFFIETDRSSEPIERSNQTKSDFYQKSVKYLISWQQGLFSKNWGFKKARVLTVTRSERRIESMLALNKKLDPRGEGFGLFLFAQDKIADLKDPERVFQKNWINGRGEQVSILD